MKHKLMIALAGLFAGAIDGIKLFALLLIIYSLYQYLAV